MAKSKVEKPLIDKLTGEKILIVTSEDSLISAIKNLEPVIEIKGDFAKSCTQAMHIKDHKKEFGDGLKVGGFIVVILGIMAGGPLGILGAIMGAGSIIGGSNLGKDGKNVTKYKLEMVSEDDVVLRLKKLL